MQTVQQYIEALALGQKAFEEPLAPATPLPHIFGSAAYIQDPHTGLSSLHPKPETPTEEQDVIENASRNLDSVHLPSATLNHPPPSAHQSSEPVDSFYQPQNLKAMLEAALKGDLPSHAGAVPDTAPSKQHQPESPAASTQAASKAWQDSHQPDGAVGASADLPHVLAWLEQGRGLFDDDE